MDIFEVCDSTSAEFLCKISELLDVFFKFYMSVVGAFAVSSHANNPFTINFTATKNTEISNIFVINFILISTFLFSI